MSTEQNAPEADETVAEPSLARFLIAFALSLAISIPIGILAMSHFRDLAYDARAEALTEKYGVTIESIDPVLRDGAPVTWSVDGVERECLLSRESDTLRCEDEDGALVEVGK